MKDIRKEIVFNNKKYSMVFNLNVMEELQNKYGSLQEWLNKVETQSLDNIDITALKYGLTLMFNEGIDIENDNLSNEEKKPFLTEKQVGRMITDELITKFNKTMDESTKIDDLPKNE